jgi:hypothetical protein
MHLVRQVIASSANRSRAVFSPHEPVLNILYATTMLQQEFPCDQRAPHPHIGVGSARFSDEMLFYGHETQFRRESRFS